MLPMNLSQLFGLACLTLLVAMSTSAQEHPAQETCPPPKGWKPTNAELQRVLSEHRKWVEKSQATLSWEGRANLCNADLRGTDLSEAQLSFAQLNGANLSGAKLNKAELIGAELNKANLTTAELNQANLSSAELNEADLSKAKLNEANLTYAKLNEANLTYAKLNKAILWAAELNKANLSGAELNGALLTQAKLNEANLIAAKLNKAGLFAAELNKANLSGADLTKAALATADLNEAVLSSARLQEAFVREASVRGAHLDRVDLTGAVYAPNSPPPDGYVAPIKGLQSVYFPDGEEVGLVQLRDLLQKAGLRDLEREATFALENGRTNHSLARNTPGGIAEGVFRKVAFDLPTRYGLEPARALFSIVVVWALLIPVYSWPIWHQPKRLKRASGIYRVLPKIGLHSWTIRHVWNVFTRVVWQL